MKVSRRQLAQRSININMPWSCERSSHLVRELSRDIVIMGSLGITEELAVCRVHDGDTELNNVLLVVLFYHIGIL